MGGSYIYLIRLINQGARVAGIVISDSKNIMGSQYSWNVTKA